MKKLLLFFAISMNFLACFSQKKESYFLKSLVFGTSLTFKWDGSAFNSDFFQEYTWHMNGGITLHKQAIIGIQTLKILSKSGSKAWNSSYIYGFFTQYDFFPKQKFRLFSELSINRGNYCTCGNFDPYTVENLNYLGYGFGFDLPISSHSDKLVLDVSFYNYLILNDIDAKYNYTQYIIGLNYYFGKKIK